MYLLRFCIFIQALSISLSFDVELEGIVRLGDDFLDRLTTKQNKDLRRNIKMPRIIARSSVMRANSVVIDRTNDLIEYKDHLIKVGVKALNSLKKKIVKKMKIGNDLAPYINAACDKYKRTMSDYFEYISEQKEVTLIDEELLFLDLMETASRVIYGEERKLLNDAIMLLNIIENDNLNIDKTAKDLNTMTGKDNVQEINEIIFKQGIQIKTEQFRYICNKYEICRPYPAFSDYFAVLLVELLKLPDDEFETFIRILRTIGPKTRIFFEKICKKGNLDEIIVPEITEVFNNPNSVKEYLLLIRGIIIQRFKIINTPDLKLKFRTRAMRILIDIVNKAFQSAGNGKIFEIFDTVVQNLRNRNDFLQSTVTDLFINTISTLDVNLSTNAKNEISVLIDTILKGSSDDELFGVLFGTGSKYVKGEDGKSHFV